MQNYGRVINRHRLILRKILKPQCSCSKKKYNYKLYQTGPLSSITLTTSKFDQCLGVKLNYSISSLEDQAGDSITYEKACEETLETLTEYFEEIVESSPHLSNADVSYSNGVLSVNLGPKYGTYVINRQIPNRQIWLSSPVSGPKRYDFINEGAGYWLYKHDGQTLHQLLQKEIENIAKIKVDFSKCAHSKL